MTPQVLYKCYDLKPFWFPDVIGRNDWGIYPLKGKLLNVRDASLKQITNNKEVRVLKCILGLQDDKEYHSTNELRYGSIMIMTDQDLDGSHIKGLIINFFDHFYPSLLKQPGFLQEFITPIVKCTKNDKTISFFTLTEYKEWKRSNNDGRGWTIKYYKSLAHHTLNEIKEYGGDLGKYVKRFKPMDEEDRKLIEMVFAKKNANKCKIWIRRGCTLTIMIVRYPSKTSLRRSCCYSYFLIMQDQCHL